VDEPGFVAKVEQLAAAKAAGSASPVVAAATASALPVAMEVEEKKVEAAPAEVYADAAGEAQQDPDVQPSSTHDQFFVKCSDVEGDSEVGFVDVEAVEWWTLVPTSEEMGMTPSRTMLVETQSLGGPFVAVEESDVVEAMAEFLTLYLMQMPQSKSLAPQELVRVMSGALGELAEKGAVRRLWDWGQFLYSYYSYASITWGVYQDPAIAYAVMRAVWTCSKWMLKHFI